VYFNYLKYTLSNTLSIIYLLIILNTLSNFKYEYN
jgi:hypothetical protein